MLLHQFRTGRLRRDHSVTARHREQTGFSLVEVTIAIGIAAFGIFPIMGLLPTGLNVFHRAIDASIGSQISQRLINDAQQTDFDTLVDGNTTRFVVTTVPRYFDDQGNEVAQSGSAVYYAQTVVSPRLNTPSLSSTTGNVHLAGIIVQIAKNPAHANLSRNSSTMLWTNTNLPIVTCSAIVSDNQ